MGRKKQIKWKFSWGHILNMVKEKIKNFFNNLFNSQQEEVRHVEINPQSVQDNHIIKAQEHQIAELQGSLTRKNNEEAAERESAKDIDEEEIIKAQLNDQEFEIQKRSFGKAFSMKQFWASYFGVPVAKAQNPGTKLARALKYVTFDRSSDIAPFDDIMLSGNYFVLTTKNNKVVLRTQELKDIFQSVGALSRDITSGMIPINLDADGGYVENLMMWKPAEVINGEDGFEFKTARKEPLYKMLQDKEDHLLEYRERLEAEELTNVELQNKVNDLQSSIKITQKSSEIANNEKTKMTGKVSDIEKVFYNVQQDLTRMQQISVIDQDNIHKLESQIVILRAEAERQGATTAFLDAINKIEQIASVTLHKDVAVSKVTEPVVKENLND